MADRVLAVLLMAALGILPSIAPARAGAADVVRPVRTLVYDVTVKTETARRARRSAGGPNQIVSSRRSGLRRSASASAEAVVLSAVERQASIQVDVIALSEDGGIVLDLTEQIVEGARTKVRLAIAGDGAIKLEREGAANVTAEDLALGRWLARGFYGEHPTEAGTSWTVDQSGDGAVATERYRVVSSAGRRITLEYELDQKGAGPDAYAERRIGSLVYDRFFVAPIHATYQGEVSRGSISDTLLTSVSLTLRTDSLGKRT